MSPSCSAESSGSSGHEPSRENLHQFLSDVWRTWRSLAPWRLTLLHSRDFQYELPAARIAARPCAPRDACKLLVADRATGEVSDRIFRELPDLLRPDDLLVLNEAAVRPARLFAKRKTGGRVEVFLLEKLAGDEWNAMLKPGRRIAPGEKLRLEDGVEVEILAWREGGKLTL